MAEEKGRKPKRSRRNRTFPSRVFMTRTRVTLARFDFITKVRFKLARFDWSELRDNFELVLKLAWVVFLYGFFVIAPLRIGAIYGPGWGVLVALLGFPIWGTLGVAPRHNGCFSVSEFLYKVGYGMILLSVVGTTLKFLIPFLR